MANGKQAKPVKQGDEWEALPSADEWEALPSAEELGDGRAINTSSQKPKRSWFQIMRDYTPEGLTRRGLESAAEFAERKRAKAEEAQIRGAARGEEPEYFGKYGEKNQLRQFGYGALRDVLNMGGHAIQPTPKEAAIGAATIALPEIMSPMLIGHGLYQAGTNAPEALRGDPGAARAALLGAAEAAGGGALGRGALRAGAPTTATGRAVQYARERLGTRLSASAAQTPRTAGAFQPALGSPPREVLEHAAKEGVELTPAQAMEAPIARNLQAAGERGLVSGKTLNEAIELNRVKFGQAVKGFSERVDPKRMGLSEEQAGETIRQSAETAKSVAHENAMGGYQQIKWLDETPVNVSGIRAKYFQELKDAETVLANAPREVAAKIRQALERGSELGTPKQLPDGTPFVKPEVSFRDAIQLRSFFREMGETAGADLPKQYQGIFRRLSKDIDGAMESAAKQAGGEQEWRAANAGWKDYAAKYGDKQSPLYKVLGQSDPAKVTRSLLNNASAKDIEILKAEGMDSAVEALRRQAFEDIARNKFTVGRDGLGGYQDSFLKTLFGPEGVKELYLKADIARRIGWEVNPSGTSNVMLAAEQLGKPSRIAELMGAAKMSMPRPATSYLPRGTPTLFPDIAQRVRAALFANAARNGER